MVRVYTGSSRETATEEDEVPFDPESQDYYPTACCESLHVKNAVLASTVLQIFFCVLLGFLYLHLDNNGFLRAVDIFRVSLIFLFTCNAVGLICAMVGVLQERIALVQVQTMILTSLVVLADALALCLVLIMALGKENYTTSHIPGVFIDTDRVEHVLGPFWIYLIAIMCHMTAAGTMCFIGIYNRYCRFLRDKSRYTKLSQKASGATVVSVNPGT